MPINELTPVNEWPTRKLPQDRFDDAVKKAMDQMSVMVDELNENFIPQTNESVKVINKISPNIDTILDAPNQAAAASASAQQSASSAQQAAESASAASSSAQQAKSSATTSASKASKAAESASAAATSAQQSASSAQQAAESASAAATSAQQAKSSATTSASKASHAAESASAAATSAQQSASSAQQAAESASAASSSAQQAKSSATTATSEANRAKEEADRAASVVAVDIATPEKAGIVKPDGTITTTDSDGTLRISTFTGSKNGLVPASGAAAGKVLYGDGTWGEVGLATTEKAGLVKPDGATLKIADAAGKVAVEDVLFNNSISLASSGLLGKARYIVSSQSFNIDTDDFDLVVINASSEHSSGTYPPFPGFLYIRQFYYSRTSPTVIGNRMQVAFAYNVNRMWRRYHLNGSWSAWVKVIDETDIATSTTPGIIKVGRGLAAFSDGTLHYTGMGAATLSVGGNTRLNASSARNFVLTATGASPNVFLPDPTPLYAGEQFTFFAEGDNIQVRDFHGQAVGPVLTRGKAYLFTLINRTTGEWARAEFSASGTSGENGGSLGFQPSISAPVIFSDVADAYSTDIELETGRVLHFGAPSTSTTGEFNSGTLSLVSVTGWGAVSVKNTPLTLPQDFTLHDFCKLSSSLCCVLAKDTKTKKKFAVILVDVSGATAVVGTANILTTTGKLMGPIFSRVDDAHALLVYGDDTSLYARLYSFSGSTITAATPVLVREASSTNINRLDVQRMDDTRWLIWTGGLVLQVLEVSGTAVTVGEPVTFTPDASWEHTSFQAVSPAPGGDVLIYISYSRQDGSTYQDVNTLLVYTSSGLVLTEGTLTEVSGGYYNSRFLNIAGRMFLWSKKTGSSKNYYLVPVTVSNGTATAGAECLIFTTSESFYNNLTLLTYTGDTYAIMSVYSDDYGKIHFLRGGFTIASDGSLAKCDSSGPATSISNIVWGRNPCIQAFSGGRYVYTDYYRSSQSASSASTTVHLWDGSFTEQLCSAKVDGFASKPYVSTIGGYLYPSVFPTGEAQALVILNQYDSRKPAWALFTL